MLQFQLFTANKSGNKEQNKKKNRRDTDQSAAESSEVKGIPMKVVGLVDDKESPQNGFKFLIEYTNGEASLVSRREAHVSCPQVVIQFYEDNLEFTDVEKKKKQAAKNRQTMS